jgi:hypothetical protein
VCGGGGGEAVPDVAGFKQMVRPIVRRQLNGLYTKTRKDFDARSERVVVKLTPEIATLEGCWNGKRKLEKKLTVWGTR